MGKIKMPNFMASRGYTTAMLCMVQVFIFGVLSIIFSFTAPWLTPVMTIYATAVTSVVVLKEGTKISKNLAKPKAIHSGIPEGGM